MAKKPNEKHLTFCIDGKLRDQFQKQCKTHGVSAATVLRQWVEHSLRSGSIELQSANRIESKPITSPTNTDKTIIQNILSRLDEIERQTAYLNENQMEFIKDEVLGEKFGTLRNRMGVVEKEIHELGGNIAR